MQAQKYNAGYLGAKHRRMSHILSPELYSDEEEGEAQLEQEPLQGQFCFFDHEVGCLRAVFLSVLLSLDVWGRHSWSRGQSCLLGWKGGSRLLWRGLFWVWM